MRLSRLALVVAAAALLLAGCATGAGDYPVTPVEPGPVVAISAAPVPAAVPPPGVPVKVAIPKLGVTDNIVPVGLAADGSMEVPDVTETGWYELAPRPGSVGSAVVISHVDYRGVPGAFARIDELRLGDEVRVTDVAGIERNFVVFDSAQVPKSEFMSRTVPLVFDSPPGPELRMVTCGGDLVGHSYLSNVIVRARLAA